MKFIKKISKNQNKMQRILGLKSKLLDLLVKRVKTLWDKAEKDRLSRPERKRGIGAGRQYKLENIDIMVIAVLLYYKQHMTQEFLGLLFDIDQSSISRLLQKMLPLIEEAADPELKTYLAKIKEEDHGKRIGSWDEFLMAYPCMKDVSTDTTEQQIYRSQDDNTQRKYFSGKTKQHAIKTQISVCSSSGKVLDVSNSYCGSMHDKKIMDKEKTILKFPEDTTQRHDSGFQGIKDEYPKHTIILPIKKPKNGTLSVTEKEHNKNNSKVRVRSEHAFSKIKKFRICSSIFRQPLEKHNQTFRNVAALVNFKLKHHSLAI